MLMEVLLEGVELKKKTQVTRARVAKVTGYKDSYLNLSIGFYIDTTGYHVNE